MINLLLIAGIGVCGVVAAFCLLKLRNRNATIRRRLNR